MTDMICVDKNYSTTRLLTREQPVIETKPEDKFESVLFLPEGEDRNGEGGLRTQGYFKAGLVGKPLITVITVVFNGEQFLEETILSVINQTYDNVEYIIIDGGSMDRTLDIIRKYEQVIDYWVSEKDCGIFGAMNKGAELASGDYVYFLNAGDNFSYISTLSDIFNLNNTSLTDDHTLVIGHVILTFDNKVFSLANRVNVNIPHQGAFVKKEVFCKFRFDESSKIFGDAIFWQLLEKNGVFTPVFTDIIVAQFPMDGVGSSPEYIWQRFHESKKLLLASNDYVSIARRFILSVIGYGIYKVFGMFFYFKVYIKTINYLVKIRG